MFRDGKWHFDMDGDGRWSPGDKTATFGQKGDLPVIGDADTGFGAAVNVVRTIKEYERAGACAVHIEDQLTPKRPLHQEGGEDAELAVCRRPGVVVQEGLQVGPRATRLSAKGLPRRSSPGCARITASSSA